MALLYSWIAGRIVPVPRSRENRMTLHLATDFYIARLSVFSTMSIKSTTRVPREPARHKAVGRSRCTRHFRMLVEAYRSPCRMPLPMFACGIASLQDAHFRLPRQLAFNQLTVHYLVHATIHYALLLCTVQRTAMLVKLAYRPEYIDRNCPAWIGALFGRSR